MDKIREAFKHLIDSTPYPYQSEIIKHLLNRVNVFGVVPTGSGKSMCYQVIACLKKGLVLVFSPLISLMKDQVDSCNAMGLRAERITFDVSDKQITRIFRDIQNYDLLYIAPERLKSIRFLEKIRRTRLSLIALDEFHEHSKSGKDFRPSYSLVSDFIESRPKIPVVALTATADTAVERSFLESLRNQDYKRTIASPNRTNLKYKVTQEVSPRLVANLIIPIQEEGGSCIVYCATRRTCDSLNLLLIHFSVNTRVYHGGLSAQQRSETQEAWMEGLCSTVVATNAFGMGINKPNVRLVFHYGQPGSIFQYLQEAGRAGRDGLESDCFLNLSQDGLRVQQFFVDMQNPPLSVYETIWEELRSKKRNSFTTTLARLTYLCGIGKQNELQITSALCFMEYCGCLAQSPSSSLYELPIRNLSLCQEFASRNPFIKLSNRLCTINLPPSQLSPVPSMVESGAVLFQYPKKFLKLRRLRRTLSVTLASIQEKRNQALEALNQVNIFANKEDKQEYIEQIFLKRSEVLL